jgi:effector-associated domain 1 (EAD1)-containing protein
MTDAKALEAQLLARYPERADLERFLKHKLDRKLEHYAGPGLNLVDAVYQLVQDAAAEA